MLSWLSLWQKAPYLLLNQPINDLNVQIKLKNRIYHKKKPDQIDRAFHTKKIILNPTANLANCDALKSRNG